MIVFREEVWSGGITGTASQYSDVALNAVLADAEQFGLFVRATQVSGTSPTLSVDLEHSNDGVNWATKTQLLTNTSISAGATGVGAYFAQDLGLANAGGSLVRIRIALGGTNPSAQLQLKLVGRSAPERQQLDLASGGTFTRSSEGSYQTGGSSLAWASSNVRRFEDRGDGTGPLLLLEGAATNVLLRSEEFDNAAWSKVNVTVTADATTAPDGAADADLLQRSAGTGKVTQGTGLSAAPVNFSVWLKKGASSQSVTLRLTDGTNTATTTVTPTTAWARYDVRLGTVSAAVTAEIEVGSSAGNEVYAWGAQTEANGFPTSYIRTTSATVNRVKDVLTYSPIPAPFASGRWGIVFRPLFTNLVAEYAAATAYTLVSVNDVHDQFGFQDIYLFAVQDGFTRVSLNPGGFARQALIVAEIDARISSLDLAGDVATPGHGTGVAYAWSTASGELRIGGRQDGGGLELPARVQQVYFYA